MKKIILITLVALGVMGCETRNVDVKSTDTVIRGRPINTYTIDSCEYIGRMIGSNTDVLAHKGNCSNPVHKKL